MNPAQQKKIIFAAIIILTILCGVLFFRKADKIKYAQQFNFHPDSVLAFDWSVGGQSFHFTRKSRREEWQPQVDHELINRKLMALGTLAVGKMSAPRSGLKLSVNFGGDNQWNGTYSGQKFVWTEGNLVDQGLVTSGPITKIFEEGQWAFNLHVWNWCQARPNKIDAEWPGHSVHVYQKKYAWFIKQEKAEAPLDATRVEKWLSTACQSKFGFFRDLQNFPQSFMLADGHLKIEFEGGMKADYPLKNDFFKIDDTQAVSSEELLQSFQELAMIPK